MHAGHGQGEVSLGGTTFAMSMRDHIDRLVSGSSPVVGSSRNTIDGLPIREIARETRLFIPPLSLLTSLSAVCPSSTETAESTARSSHSLDGTPLI